jgi:hypothetical protein
VSGSLSFGQCFGMYACLMIGMRKPRGRVAESEFRHVACYLRAGWVPQWNSEKRQGWMSGGGEGVGG